MAVETGIHPGAVLGTASCVACGGPVPVSLLEPGPRCPFCGSASPLAKRLAGRLAHLHALRSRRTAREEQLAGRQARLGTSFTVPMLLFGVLPLYALVAAGAWFTFPRPRGAGVLSLLLLEPPHAGSEGTVTWWVLWAVATAFAAATLLWGTGLLKLRRLVAFAAPEPPALPGAPPRCRCCGSGLRDPGPILRCRSCGADSVASPGGTRAAEASLEEALARFEKRLSASLATRSARAFRLLSVAATAPIALAVLSPLGLLVKRCPPALWLATAALLAGGIALLAAAARVQVPAIRTLEGARTGDTVELEGVPWLVVSAHRLGGTGSWSGLLVLLASGSDAPPERLLHARSLPGKDELGLTELETVEAGAPGPAGDPGPGLRESYPLSAAKGNPPPWNVELQANVRLLGGRLEGLELRGGQMRPAAALPLLAARTLREVAETGVLFAAAPEATGRPRGQEPAGGSPPAGRGGSPRASLRRLAPLLAGVACVTLAGRTASAPPETRDAAEKAVAAVRTVHAGVDAAIERKELRTAQLRIGGGQNPVEVTVHYRGGTAADFEKDPYSAPFVPRRVVVHQVLPAVGDAWARFTYDADGALVFAFTTGPDISGVKGYELRPGAELRAYYQGGEPIRVIHPGPDGGPPRTVDLGLAQDVAARTTARTAAAALLERGNALAGALATLSR